MLVDDIDQAVDVDDVLDCLEYGSTIQEYYKINNPSKLSKNALKALLKTAIMFWLSENGVKLVESERNNE